MIQDDLGHGVSKEDINPFDLASLELTYYSVFDRC